MVAYGTQYHNNILRQYPEYLVICIANYQGTTVYVVIFEWQLQNFEKCGPFSKIQFQNNLATMTASYNPASFSFQHLWQVIFSIIFPFKYLSWVHVANSEYRIWLVLTQGPVADSWLFYGGYVRESFCEWNSSCLTSTDPCDYSSCSYRIDIAYMIMIFVSLFGPFFILSWRWGDVFMWHFQLAHTSVNMEAIWGYSLLYKL